MPTPVDLVTDLPADFEVFGQAVDSTLADLKGGTTGQVLSKNSNTDMDFVWVTDAAGDITGVTAGTGISGGGTSGTVTITNSMATAITTAGDLIKGTGSGTFDRLGIGSTGQVLTVSAGAPAWATPTSGGMTQLATGTLSGTAVTLSSISQSYKHLKLDIFGATPNVQDFWALRFNGLTAGSYCTSNYAHAGATVYNYGSDSDNAWFIRFDAAGNYYFTNGYNHLSLDLFDYTSTTPIPLAKSAFSGQLASGTYASQSGVHSYKASSAAITSLTIRTNGGATLSGGTYILWGIN